ncbi:hypothetical protein HMPREF3067_07955 [Corynebacterium sp. HMSC04H06]|nr:hypothetical protein HMPREF3067_07955 [Corynebacterium sp. HMSC04H06]
MAPLVDNLRQAVNSAVEIGLGYLSLDRPAGTPSGGEAQRTRMVRHLGSALTDITYVFDEPTAGLHLLDTQVLLELLDELVDSGHTVVCVEHRPAVIAHADHVIDLGPGAGSAGGRVVASTSSCELNEVADSVTGSYLARYLAHEAQETQEG